MELSLDKVIEVDRRKDLFSKENDIIRKRLQHHGIQGLLRKKALQFKKMMDHLGIEMPKSTAVYNVEDVRKLAVNFKIRAVFSFQSS